MARWNTPMEHMGPLVRTETRTETGSKRVERSEGCWTDKGVIHIAYISRRDEDMLCETGDKYRFKGAQITMVHGGRCGRARNKKYMVKRSAEEEKTSVNGVVKSSNTFLRQDAYFQSDESDSEDVSKVKAGEAYIVGSFHFPDLDFSTDVQSKKKSVQCKEKV